MILFIDMVSVAGFMSDIGVIWIYFIELDLFDLVLICPQLVMISLNDLSYFKLKLNHFELI